ncbi:hypothetical protein F4806DRAFT_166640 [Annulohypoxylon nitens]|nr:hypothetical protein F4806DRAFT_166640 [Annulohypoxylon nitens]
MSRIGVGIGNPMLTADQVRQRFGEPKHKKSKSMQYFTEAMAKIEKAVRRTSLPIQDTSSFVFNDLPSNVRQNIFKMVQASPSWVNLIYQKRQLVGIEGGSQEIYVNREWYQSPILRQGLSRSDQFDQLNNSSPTVNSPKRGGPLSKRTSMSRDRRTAPPVRVSTDWIFFNGRVPMNFHLLTEPLPFNVAEIRTVVFRVERLFYCIQRGTEGGEGSDFMLAKGSHVEDFVILLRDFRKEVPPEKLVVVRTYQVENVDEEIDEEIDETKLTCPDGGDLSRSESYMMARITKAWSRAVVSRRERQYAWLESPDGRQWLSYSHHGETNTISKWLATEEGHKWLGSNGSEFLASESGWWWLASDLGFPWLETQQGLQWLDTEGMWFLSSPQALLWVNTGISSGKVHKAWFETSAGMTWASKICPQGVPPNPPQRPTGHLPRDSFIDQSFNNINFRGWKFVKCKDVA